MIDETSEISGHVGGLTGRFALRYGFCLVELLAAAELPPGRFTCPPPEDGWTVVRELLMPASSKQPDLVDGSTLPAPVASLAGLHWALVGDTLVLVAPVKDPRGVRLLYRSTNSRGGIFDATITNHSIQATVSSQSTVTLSADAGGTITLTSPDGAKISAPLRLGD